MFEPGTNLLSEFDVRSRNISSRHSTRRFLSDPISDEDLEGILDAGLLAPSSKNRQPWQVIVLRNGDVSDLSSTMSKKISDDISNTEDPELVNDLKMALRTMDIIRNVPVLLIIGYLDRKSYHNARMMPIGVTDRKLMDLVSIGAFIENIILEASERNIGSLWIGDYLYAYDILMDVLEPGFDIVSLVALGYPADDDWSRVPRSADRIEYR